MANNRALLDRMNGVVVHMVVMADDVKLDCDEIVRALDTHKIHEAKELARILFTMFGGKVAPAPKEILEALPALAEVTGAIGVGARSCWTRHMLRKMQQEVVKFERESRDGFTKSYDNLVGVLSDMEHAAHSYRNVTCYTPKIGRIMQRVRELPNAYRDFYIRIDGLLLP
jgi:hypothetical protein